MRLIAVASLSLVAGQASAAPPTLEPVAINGVQYEGLPGVISATLPRSSINNHGQWTATVISSDTKGSGGRFILSNDGIRYDPRSPIELGPDLVIEPWGSAYLNSAINNLGQIVATARGPAFDAQGNPQGFRSVLLIDGVPIVQTGDVTPFGFTYPDDFHSSRPVLNDQGTLLANFELGFSPIPQYDTLLRFDPEDGGGYSSSVVAAPGLPFPDGSSINSLSAVNRGSFDLNNNGDTVFSAVLARSGESNRAAIVLNGEIVAESGSTDLFPAASMNVSSKFASINDNGDFAFYGSISSDDWDGFRLAVVKNNDEVVWIDDGSNEQLIGYSIGTFQDSLLVSDIGDVFWQTDIYDSIGARYSAFFQNDQLLATSDPTIDGVLHIDGLFRTQVSDNGQWAIFDTQDGVFRAQIPSPASAVVLGLGVLPALRRRR